MKQTIQQNDAAVGLIMLGQKGTVSLFDKYDNSTLLPVDAAQQVDFRLDPNAKGTALKITKKETQINDSVNTDKTMMMMRTHIVEVMIPSY